MKREAMRLAQTSGKPIAQVAYELGMSDPSLHQWRCETLEVSVSGYDDSRRRPMSEHTRSTYLAEQLQIADHGYRGVYGSPRLFVELHERGISCSRKRVAGLMRELEFCTRRTRYLTRTTRSDPAVRVDPNLLNRDFTALCPNEKWTGDIMDVWTYEGWLYLLVVLDLFLRWVVG